jgi:hypothetical protein
MRWLDVAGKKRNFLTGIFAGSIISLAFAPAGVDGIDIGVSLAVGNTGIVLGIAVLAAGHLGVGRYLKVLLLREVDCVIVDSGNECPGNRYADHEQHEADKR